MLVQAMAELAELYREDSVSLSQQFVWMNLLLERSDTIDLEEKQKMRERLKMYDPLWEEHPKVKKIRAESKAEGKVETLQKTLVHIVKVRFPDLADFAQQQVTRFNEPVALDLLLDQVLIAPDEVTVRFLLSSLGG